MKAKIFAALAILAGSVQAKAEYSYVGEVTVVYSHPDGSAAVVLNARHHCNNGDIAVIHKESPNYNDMYTMMLGAFMTGKTLRLFLKGECNGNRAIISHGGIFGR
jgi:hypothetical protein